MEQSIFKKTRIPRVRESLATFYGEKAGPIFLDAEKILKREIEIMDDRGNKIVSNHLKNNILPGYAVYQALLNFGEGKEVAIKFVEVEMCAAVQRMAKLCKKLSNKKYGYSIFKLGFGFVVKFGYPKQGWTVEYIEKSNKRVCFNITTCLYCEELEKRNSFELCSAFCQTDHAAYDSLAPAVVFKRKGTLASTGNQCDFCFERKL